MTAENKQCGMADGSTGGVVKCDGSKVKVGRKGERGWGKTEKR